MRLRRSLHRRREPPPVLLPSLERLAELIERVVELIDQVPAAPAANAMSSPESQTAPEPDLAPSVDGHVFFVPSPDGYRLLEREGAPPVAGELLGVEAAAYCVLRLGPSPLPGDRRRCAYLEGKEPPVGDRNFDG